MRRDKAYDLKGYPGSKLPISTIFAGLICLVLILGFASTTATEAANLFKVADAPILDLNGPEPDLDYETTFVEDENAAAIVAEDLTITYDGSELSSATISLKENPDHPQELLDVTIDQSTSKITKSYDVANDVLTLTGIDKVESYEEVLSTVTYSNKSQAPDTARREVEFIIRDEASESDPVSSTIEIIAVNDAPVLDNSGDMHLDAINENEQSPKGSSVESIISSAEQGGEDRITDPDLIDPEGIAVIDVGEANGTWEFSIDSGSTWSGFGEAKDSSAILLSLGDFVRFVPNADYIGQASFTFRAWDQTTEETSGKRADASINGETTAFSTAADSVTVDVLAVNNNYAPVLILAEDTIAQFTEGNGSVVIAGPTLQIVDIDSDHLLSATVSIGNMVLNEPDILNATTNGSGIIAEYNGTTGTLRLTGEAALSDYQAALRSVTFDNSSQDPAVHDRTIAFTVNDGIDSSNEVFGTVRVESVNDDPWLDLNGEETVGRDNTVYYNEEKREIGGSVQLASALQIQDVDNTSLISATVYLENRPDGTLETLSIDTTDTNITASYNDEGGEIELTGTDSLIAYQQVLRTAAYSNESARAHRANRAVTFSIVDASFGEARATSKVIVLPKYVHLPFILYQAIEQPVVEEPNDSCREAVSITINLDYDFEADDEDDWFSFTLAKSATVSVEVTEFAPEEGQLLVAQGTCDTLKLVGHNGDFSTSKIVSAGTLEPGRYYIWLINDGRTDLDEAYNLRVSVE